jgi:hypothetical protein
MPRPPVAPPVPPVHPLGPADSLSGEQRGGAGH